MQMSYAVVGHVITFKMVDNKIKTKVIPKSFFSCMCTKDEVIVLFYKKLNQLNVGFIIFNCLSFLLQA